MRANRRVSGTSVAALLVVLGTVGAPAPAPARLKEYPPSDVTNFALGPEYAQWLVGPIAHIASAQERESFLRLSSDSEAEAFVDDFWESRGPNLVFPPTGPKITFDERAEEADRVFTEGTHLGRRTDRGTVLILYGPPRSIEYATSPSGLGPPVEIWNYSKKGELGLDGRKPERRYGFRRQGTATEFFSLAGVKKLRPTAAPPGTRQ